MKKQLFFLFIFLNFFMFKSFSIDFGVDYDYSDFTQFSRDRILIELDSLLDSQFLADNQRTEYSRKADFHKREGHRCFNAAKDCCKLIPNRSDRENILSLFNVCISTAAGAMINWPTALGTLLVHLGSWAVNYHQEYWQMKTLLNEAKYHYEMSIFYQDVLKSG